MRNISYVRRLIKDFKKQDRSTIFQHLNALGKNPHIYSDHQTGIGPHLFNNHFYIYAAYQYEGYRGLVVVCLDDNPPKEELADEKPLYKEPPCYYNESSRRTSPVWQLSETIKLIRKKMEEGNNHWPILGVLLTESTFINAEDMQDTWDEMNIIVFDKQTDLSNRKIPVNRNEDLSYGAMLMSFIKELNEQPEQADTNNKELTERHDKFMNDPFLLPDTDLRDDVEEEQDEEEKEEEEEEDFPDFELPSGDVEQNNNVSVKVKILPPMPNPRKELNKLVGCKDIKKRIDELIALTRYNKMVLEAFPKAKVHEVSLHSVFLGRPGTGKTTVCKIYGSLLREAGALSKGHVVVADRGTFIGTLWGDEERSVRQVLEIAQGGVLMIDEAYLLNSKSENDPGRMVLQLLMQILADETQRDIAVVICGYKEPMMKLLDSNPGLPSRFPNRYEFQDFTVDELLEITRRRVKEYEYEFTTQAWEKYRNVLTQAYEQRDPQTWGNARFIGNLLERIYIQHATRCMKERPADKWQMRQLTPEDICTIAVPRPKARIGF